MKLHIHRAQHSDRHGSYAYDVCRCSAVRTRKVASGYSAIQRDWPRPRDGWAKACASR